jgi:hypothetical protein
VPSMSNRKTFIQGFYESPDGSKRDAVRTGDTVVCLELGRDRGRP